MTQMTKPPTWRRWARRLLPPIMVDLVRPPASPRPKITWRGVYPERADVPARRDSYDAELLDDMVAYTRAAYEGRGDQIPLWHETFVTVAALIASRASSVFIVDFGGGTGSAFVQLIAALPREVNVRYLVIDRPQVCAAGRAIFGDDPRITFATALPSGGAEPDLVYANSVLQYVDSYDDALRSLAALGAPHLLLARLCAWEGPRFATGQVNLPGRTLANWFLDVREVTSILAACGYRLSSDCLSEKRYQADFPATHPVDRLRTTLFSRTALSPS